MRAVVSSRAAADGAAPGITAAATHWNRCARTKSIGVVLASISLTQARAAASGALPASTKIHLDRRPAKGALQGNIGIRIRLAQIQALRAKVAQVGSTKTRREPSDHAGAATQASTPKAALRAVARAALGSTKTTRVIPRAKAVQAGNLRRDQDKACAKAAWRDSTRTVPVRRAARHAARGSTETQRVSTRCV